MNRLKYIVVFFILIIAVDFIFGIYLQNQQNRIKTGIYGVINQSINSDSEILILGSSRARHHYIPSLISDSIKRTCYNSGAGGYGLFLNYAILNERIQNSHKPKVVILDMSPNVIVDKNSYTKLNTLLPYYKKYASFKEIIALDPDFSHIKVFSKIYQNNSIVYDIIMSSFFAKGQDNNGYLPLMDSLNTTNYKPFYLENKALDKNKFRYLNKIIDLCKDNDIRLIGCISPTYEKFDTYNFVINKIDSIFNKSNTEFYDYSKYEKTYKKTAYFKDQLHLNNAGAKVFSSEISKKIENAL